MLAIALSLAAPAMAQTKPHAEAVPGIAGRVDGRLKVQLAQPDASGWGVLDLKSAHRVWSLMGEPVAYCTASWKLVNLGMVSLHGKDQQQRSLAALQIPPEVLREVALVEARMAIPVHERNAPRDGHARYYVPCDLGVMNANGDPAGSFNVPGSPDWKRFALHERFKVLPAPAGWQFDENYASADEARAMLKAGPARYEIRPPFGGEIATRHILHMRFNLEPVRAWLDAQETAQRSREREKRQREIRQALAASKDPFDRMLQEVETARAEQPAAPSTQASGPAQASTPLDERLKAIAAASAQDRRARSERLAASGCVLASAKGAGAPAGGEKIEADYAQCMESRASLAKFRDAESKTFGYRSANGTVRIAARYEQAQEFSEGLAWVAGGNCGQGATCAIDESGRVVLALPRHSAEPGPFRSGLSLVKQGSGPGWGYMNRSGEIVIPQRFLYARDFSDGLALVKGPRGCEQPNCFIDTSGQVALRLPYPARPFSEGLARVETTSGQKRYGFVDREGREVIPLVYDKVLDEGFRDGLVRVQGDGCAAESTCFIDRNRRTVLTVRGSASAFHEGLAGAPDFRVDGRNRGGYIDRSGRFVIPGKFAVIGDFEGGQARVAMVTAVHKSGEGCEARTRTSWLEGVINRQGEWIGQPTASVDDKPDRICLTSGRR